MKTIYLLFFLFLLLTGCHSDKGNSDYNIVVSADKMNVLYNGVMNPISVAVAGVSSNNVELKTDDGELTTDNNFNYVLSFPKQVTKAEIEILATIEGKKVSAGKYYFRVKNAPSAPVSFAGKTGEDIISKAELQQTDSIYAVTSDFVFDLKFKIVSFNMSVLLKGTFNEAACFDGAFLNQRQKELLGKVSAGDKILIEEVQAIGPDGEKRKLPGVVLTVI